MAKARSNATPRRKASPEPSAFYITTDLVVSSRLSLGPLERRPFQTPTNRLHVRRVLFSGACCAGHGLAAAADAAPGDPVFAPRYGQSGAARLWMPRSPACPYVLPSAAPIDPSQCAGK
jgi:hypothetical protein